MMDLDETASQQEIKIKFYKLAKQYHPDIQEEKSETEEAKFKAIADAYAVLSD